MKTVLFVLTLLVSTGALAQNEVGRIPNQNGGSIVLTSKACKDSGSTMMSYAHSPGLPTLFGCWIVINQEIMVEWADGDVRVYQLNTIRFSDEFKRYIAAQKQRM